MQSNQPICFEQKLYELECAIDLLGKVSDGISEDRSTTNALNGIQKIFEEIYCEFERSLS